MNETAPPPCHKKVSLLKEKIIEISELIKTCTEERAKYLELVEKEKKLIRNIKILSTHYIKANAEKEAIVTELHGARKEIADVKKRLYDSQLHEVQLKQLVSVYETERTEYGVEKIDFERTKLKKLFKVFMQYRQLVKKTGREPRWQSDILNSQFKNEYREWNKSLEKSMKPLTSPALSYASYATSSSESGFESMINSPAPSEDLQTINSQQSILFMKIPHSSNMNEITEKMILLENSSVDEVTLAYNHDEVFNDNDEESCDMIETNLLPTVEEVNSQLLLNGTSNTINRIETQVNPPDNRKSIFSDDELEDNDGETKKSPVRTHNKSKSSKKTQQCKTYQRKSLPRKAKSTYIENENANPVLSQDAVESCENNTDLYQLPYLGNNDSCDLTPAKSEIFKETHNIENILVQRNKEENKKSKESFRKVSDVLQDSEINLLPLLGGKNEQPREHRKPDQSVDETQVGGKSGESEKTAPVPEREVNILDDLLESGDDEYLIDQLNMVSKQSMIIQSSEQVEDTVMKSQDSQESDSSISSRLREPIVTRQQKNRLRGKNATNELVSVSQKNSRSPKSADKKLNEISANNSRRKSTLKAKIKYAFKEALAQKCLTFDESECKNHKKNGLNCDNTEELQFSENKEINTGITKSNNSNKSVDEIHQNINLSIESSRQKYKSQHHANSSCSDSDSITESNFKPKARNKNDESAKKKKKESDKSYDEKPKTDLISENVKKECIAQIVENRSSDSNSITEPSIRNVNKESVTMKNANAAVAKSVDENIEKKMQAQIVENPCIDSDSVTGEVFDPNIPNINKESVIMKIAKSRDERFKMNSENIEMELVAQIAENPSDLSSIKCSNEETIAQENTTPEIQNTIVTEMESLLQESPVASCNNSDSSKETVDPENTKPEEYVDEEQIQIENEINKKELLRQKNRKVTCSHISNESILSNVSKETVAPQQYVDEEQVNIETENNKNESLLQKNTRVSCSYSYSTNEYILPNSILETVPQENTKLEEYIDEEPNKIKIGNKQKEETARVLSSDLDIGHSEKECISENFKKDAVAKINTKSEEEIENESVTLKNNGLLVKKSRSFLSDELNFISNKHKEDGLSLSQKNSSEIINSSKEFVSTNTAIKQNKVESIKTKENTNIGFSLLITNSWLPSSRKTIEQDTTNKDLVADNNDLISDETIEQDTTNRDLVADDDDDSISDVVTNEIFKKYSSSPLVLTPLREPKRKGINRVEKNKKEKFEILSNYYKSVIENRPKNKEICYSGNSTDNLNISIEGECHKENRQRKDLLETTKKEVSENSNSLNISSSDNVEEDIQGVDSTDECSKNSEVPQSSKTPEKPVNKLEKSPTVVLEIEKSSNTLPIQCLKRLVTNVKNKPEKMPNKFKNTHTAEVEKQSLTAVVNETLANSVKSPTKFEDCSSKTTAENSVVETPKLVTTPTTWVTEVEPSNKNSEEVNDLSLIIEKHIKTSERNTKNLLSTIRRLIKNKSSLENKLIASIVMSGKKKKLIRKAKPGKWIVNDVSSEKIIKIKKKKKRNIKNMKKQSKNGKRKTDIKIISEENENFIGESVASDLSEVEEAKPRKSQFKVQRYYNAGDYKNIVKKQLEMCKKRIMKSRKNLIADAEIVSNKEKDEMAQNFVNSAENRMLSSLRRSKFSPKEGDSLNPNQITKKLSPSRFKSMKLLSAEIPSLAEGEFSGISKSCSKMSTFEYNNINTDSFSERSIKNSSDKSLLSSPPEISQYFKSLKRRNKTRRKLITDKKSSESPSEEAPVADLNKVQQLKESLLGIVKNPKRNAVKNLITPMSEGNSESDFESPLSPVFEKPRSESPIFCPWSPTGRSSEDIHVSPDSKSHQKYLETEIEKNPTDEINSKATAKPEFIPHFSSSQLLINKTINVNATKSSELHENISEKNKRLATNGSNSKENVESTESLFVPYLPTSDMLLKLYQDTYVTPDSNVSEPTILFEQVPNKQRTRSENNSKNNFNGIVENAETVPYLPKSPISMKTSEEINVTPDSKYHQFLSENETEKVSKLTKRLTRNKNNSKKTMENDSAIHYFSSSPSSQSMKAAEDKKIADSSLKQNALVSKKVIEKTTTKQRTRDEIMENSETVPYSPKSPIFMKTPEQINVTLDFKSQQNCPENKIAKVPNIRRTTKEIVENSEPAIVSYLPTSPILLKTPEDGNTIKELHNTNGNDRSMTTRTHLMNYISPDIRKSNGKFIPEKIVPTRKNNSFDLSDKRKKIQINNENDTNVLNEYRTIIGVPSENDDTQSDSCVSADEEDDEECNLKGGFTGWEESDIIQDINCYQRHLKFSKCQSPEIALSGRENLNPTPLKKAESKIPLHLYESFQNGNESFTEYFKSGSSDSRNDSCSILNDSLNSSNTENSKSVTLNTSTTESCKPQVNDDHTLHKLNGQEALLSSGQISDTELRTRKTRLSHSFKNSSQNTFNNKVPEIVAVTLQKNENQFLSEKCDVSDMWDRMKLMKMKRSTVVTPSVVNGPYARLPTENHVLNYSNIQLANNSQDPHNMVKPTTQVFNGLNKISTTQDYFTNYSKFVRESNKYSPERTCNDVKETKFKDNLEYSTNIKNELPSMLNCTYVPTAMEDYNPNRDLGMPEKRKRKCPDLLEDIICSMEKPPVALKPTMEMVDSSPPKKKRKKKMNKRKKEHKMIKPKTFTLADVPKRNIQDTESAMAADALDKFVVGTINSAEEAEAMVNACVASLRTVDDIKLVKAIVTVVAENVDEELDLRFTPPAPPLTSTQHRLFALFQADARFQRLYRDLLSSIRNKIVPELFTWPDDSLESFSRFYAALCKQLDEPSVALKLCVDVAVGMKQRCSIVINAVLAAWPEILPLAEGASSFGPGSTMAHIVMFTPLPERDSQKSSMERLKQLLHKYYGYSCEVNRTEWCEKAMKAIRDGETAAGLALGKVSLCSDSHWAAAAIVAPALETLGVWEFGGLSDSTGRILLNLLATVLTRFSQKDKRLSDIKNDAVERVGNILLSGKLSPSGEEIIVEEFLRLNPKGQFRSIIEKWTPQEAVSENIQSLIDTYVRNNRGINQVQKNRRKRKKQKAFSSKAQTF